MKLIPGVRVMVFNATFNNISVLSWRSVFWWRKPEYPEKTTDLSQVTDKEKHRHVAEINTKEMIITWGREYINKLTMNIQFF
jgi:hypothetical protein